VFERDEEHVIDGGTVFCGARDRDVGIDTCGACKSFTTIIEVAAPSGGTISLVR